MTEKKTVTVTIYKNEYTLKGEADAQHIIQLAHYVDSRMTEMGRKSSAPADKMAILVAMNIADDLQRLEKKNEENLTLIENLEKNLGESKNSHENAVKTAASLNEETDKIRIQLSQEKEKSQAANELKTQAVRLAENLKKQVEALSNEIEKIKAGFNRSQTSAHELLNTLEDQNKKIETAENQYNDLKKKYEFLDTELSAAREALEQALESATAPTPAHSSGAGANDKLHLLIKKIEAVLE